MTDSALAYSTYLTEFNTHYGTQGSRIDSCGLCHVDFNGGGTRTPYGEDYRNNNYSAANIGAIDSDGDGYSNDQEAALSTLTLPGFSCNTVSTAINAPANIADYVDPSSPGCVGPGQPPIANPNGPYYGVTRNLISFSSAGSTDPDGTITSYLWTFGSYGSSIEANPQFAFDLNINAVVTVTLTVTDNDGNTNSATTTATVLQTSNLPPVADAGPAVSGAANSPVQFDATGSYDPEGARLGYRWDFGDQTLAVGATPTHIYTRCGTYNVNLMVSDDFNLKAFASTTATISSSGIIPPTANAGGGVSGQYNGSLGSNVQFDGSASVDTDCNIVSYNWDFGDNTSGLGVNPVHSYAVAGNYVVTLTVTDTDGLMSSASANVNIIDNGSLNGLTLYDTNCASCHGAGTSSTKAGATVARINAGITSVAAMNSLSTLSTAEIQAIADFLATISPPPPPTGPIDGAVAYDTYCASCHGAGTSSTKAGATVARINAGITSVAAMNSLSTLSTAEIQAIADFLATISPPPPPTGPIDGAVAYDTYCASCHGAGTSSTKAGATVARINAGITSVAAMNSLSSLSSADIQAIADFLGSLAPPTTPQGLYAAYCSSCHGADGSGGSSGQNIIGDSAALISSAISGERDMQSLSFLTSAQIQSISDFLNGVTTPSPGNLDGQALYDVNCAGCHGLSSNSAKAGATLSRINSGIANEPSMAYFGTALTAAEIQAIADFLVSVAPPPPSSGDGASLYANYCASCHGAGDTSAKAGATVSRINTGISTVSSMNSLGSVLTAADIQAIADFLATTAPPTTPEGKYIAYCSSCHGVDARGGSSGKDVRGDSYGTIRDAIRGEREMRSLDFLTSSDISDIADYLQTLTVQRWSR